MRRTMGWGFAVGFAAFAGAAACSSDDTVTPSGDGGTSNQADASGGTSCGSLTACGATCADLRHDPANCGACGKACAAGEACSQGACTSTCPSGQEACTAGGKLACATLATDRQNCGACGKACADGEVCANGTCGLSCAATTTLCSGAPFVPPTPDAGPADAATDASDAASDAGDAGRDAAAPSDAGALRPYCAALQTDDDNCGACGKSCAFGEKCSGGLCCGAGFAGCGGACRDVGTDETNCGGCGVRCAAGDVCFDGACRKACPVGTLAGGQCVVTYDVPLGGLVGLADTCAAGHQHNGCNGVSDTWGIAWTDTTASSRPSRVTVELNTGIFCEAAENTHSVRFGETFATAEPFATFVGAPNRCNCDPGGASVQSFDLNPAALAKYAAGGRNVVSIAGTSSCSGLSTNAAWGGAFARVTVRY